MKSVDRISGVMFWFFLALTGPAAWASAGSLDCYPVSFRAAGRFHTTFDLHEGPFRHLSSLWHSPLRSGEIRVEGHLVGPAAHLSLRGSHPKLHFLSPGSVVIEMAQVGQAHSDYREYRSGAMFRERAPSSSRDIHRQRYFFYENLRQSGSSFLVEVLRHYSRYGEDYGDVYETQYRLYACYEARTNWFGRFLVNTPPSRTEFLAIQELLEESLSRRLDPANPGRSQTQSPNCRTVFTPEPGSR